MNFELTGTLILKEETVYVTSSFKKREFVIEVVNERNNEWNDFIKFQATQEKCSLIDQFETGDIIKVSFNIKGRKWEKDGKTSYFSNLEAWRIEKGTGHESAVAPPQYSSAPPLTADDIPPFQASYDDLPPF